MAQRDNYQQVRSQVVKVGLDEKWKENALCSGYGEEIFFRPSGVREAKYKKEIRQKRAKGFCIQCPLNLVCLAYANDSNQTDGVWGGSVDREEGLEFETQLASYAEELQPKDLKYENLSKILNMIIRDSIEPKQ